MRKGVIAVLVYVTAALFMALVVRNVVLPDEQAGMNATAGPINAFLQETAGKRVTTDFQVDYASAVALIHGEDPYGVSAEIFDRYGMPPWPVNLANPHPPTTVAVVLPFAFLSYQNALTAWTVLMLFVVIGTILLMGVRIGYAAPIGVAICVVWPGAYAIGNVVPLIGLGIALAYRYRDHPLLAAVGLTVAAAPKVSGLLLLIPFLLTLRWKPVLFTAGFMAVLTVIPVLLYPATWSRYLDVGVEAIALNAARSDNAAVLNLVAELGIPSWLATGGLVALAVGAALLIKDSFWPTVWLTVALLPIAWMYSLLTLLPLFLAAVRRPNPWGIGAVALGTALAVGSPPLGGTWPPKVLPLVVLCGFVALLQIRETDFWPRRDRYAALLGRRRAAGAARTEPLAVVSPSTPKESPPPAATPGRHADQRGEITPDLPGSAPG